MMLPLLILTIAADAPVRCNLNALTPEERIVHSREFKELLPLFTERVELRDGYRVGGPDVPLPKLAEWIARERRCCPFLRFDLNLAPEQGPLSVTIRGPKGTRELFREGFARKD